MSMCSSHAAQKLHVKLLSLPHLLDTNILVRTLSILSKNTSPNIMSICSSHAAQKLHVTLLSLPHLL